MLEQFNILINRWNTTCGGMVGNTDDFYTYEEITVTEYKNEMKAQETTTGELKEGQRFIVKRGLYTALYTGHVYTIHAHEGANEKTYYSAQRMNRKLTKELYGMANQANHIGFIDENRFQKWLEKGVVAFCDIVEVKTPYEIKKVVKKKMETPKTETTEEERTTASEPEQTEPAAPAEEEQPAAETEQEQTAEPAPDMFSTLAAAYISKKSGKAKKNPAPESKAEPEPEPIPEPKPEPEPPYIPGYHANSNAAFSEDQRRALSAGQVAIVQDTYRWDYFYFSAPYSESVRLVYSVNAYGESRETIKPGPDAKYAGFLVGTDFYGDRKTMSKKFSEDINRKLLALLPTETDAAHAAAQVMHDSEYVREKIERWKEYDYTDDARRAFYEGKPPELVLFGNSNTVFSWDELIEYIQSPEKAIEAHALRYLCDKPEALYESWIRFNRLSAAYKSIIEHPEREEHKLLKISRCISEQKTVKIELANGNEVKADADAVKRICYIGKVHDFDIAAQDRKLLNRNKYGNDADILVSDIVAIRHGGKVLWSA